MTSKVGPKGQVVIPKPIRDRLGIAPGDEVVFVDEGEAVRLQRARDPADLAGSFAAYRLSEDLEAEHRRELEREAEELRERSW